MKKKYKAIYKAGRPLKDSEKIMYMKPIGGRTRKCLIKMKGGIKNGE